MEQGIGEILTKKIFLPWAGMSVEINPVTLITTWAVILFIIALALLIRKNIKKIPGKLATTFELLYTAFENMSREALGKDAGKFTPLVFTLFIFVLLSNWIGIIPGLKSPTYDLNTCLGLGIMVFAVCHVSAILHKGIKKYILDYTKPFFFFLPLNVVGEMGKVISHSFRLFGNMYAGGIILALAGPVIIRVFSALRLPPYSASPVLVGSYMVLQGFFGLFVGTVQALVFSLLALTYIAVLREKA